MEVLHDDGSFWCSLPDLPEKRYHHTQSGLLTCGGGDTASTQTSCVTFTDGAWTSTHSLLHRRDHHVSWSSAEGVVLMGGDASKDTTELLAGTGDSILSFPLKYDTRLALIYK